MNAPDNHLAERARTLYRNAAEHLDADTLSRLRVARARALDARRAPSPRIASRWLLPGGALAAVALAALMLWQPLSHQGMGAGPTRDQTAIGAAADNELPPDADQTDPKLYQNLDFYGWLAANDAPAGRQ